MRDKKNSGKELRKQVFKKMEAALEDIRGEADAKKFSKKIKKVSDWLAGEIAKTAKKPATPKVKPATGKVKVSGSSKSPAKKQ